MKSVRKKFDYQVICHLFYEDESITVLKELRNSQQAYKVMYLFNINPGNKQSATIEQYIKKEFSDFIILNIPPKGRDIGAKLLTIELSKQLKIESDYTLVIHDKKSPHLNDGRGWRQELFKIIHPSHQPKAFAIFRQQPDVGIIGTANYIQNEYTERKTFSCNSHKQIKNILEKYDIQTTDFDFMAGNIFWIRTKILNDFFNNRSIMEIRSELESGNTLDFEKGTYIHSWERVMSWISTSQGYRIYGI